MHEVGDFLGGSVEIVTQDAQHLADFDADADLADRVAGRVPAAPGMALWQQADAVGENVAASSGTSSSAVTFCGVWDLNRVTMRQPAASIFALMVLKPEI